MSRMQPCFPLTWIGFIISLVAVLSTNVSSLNARRHLKAHQHTTEYEHPASPVSIAHPKIALLFLVTTNVKHAEIWGQWLHLAAGLHPPKSVSILASEVDLVARYGPEHPAMELNDQEIPVVQQSRDLLDHTTHSTHSNKSASRSMHTRRLHQDGANSDNLLENEAKDCLQGRGSVVVSRIYSAQSLFSIYLHSRPGHRQTQTTIFSNREVPGRVNTSYVDHSLVQAELALLREALKDPLNVKFVMVAHDAIPLYPPYIIWAQLISQGDLSHVGNQKDPKDNWRDALPAKMETQHLKVSQVVKSSQWVILTRPHAMLVIRDKHIDPIFAYWCNGDKSHREQHLYCISDEIYIATIISTFNATHETDEVGWTTNVEWPPNTNYHPYTYEPREVTSKLIQKIRQGHDDVCDWASMAESGKNVFNAWGGNRVPPKQAQPPVLTSAEVAKQRPDYFSRFLKAAGYDASSFRCPLFARKFPSSTKLALSIALLDCAGGGFSSRCDHPLAGPD